MSFIKIHSEAVLDSSVKKCFFSIKKQSFPRMVSALLFSHRNYIIDKRIARILASSASSQWSQMDSSQQMKSIYTRVAEAKAIERLLRLKD